ncbi:hypothetical protein KKG08_01110 [Patescibacteria group bacterium]|nr:hypothetical protein [Patescibacteria group bacterium]
MKRLTASLTFLLVFFGYMCTVYAAPACPESLANYKCATSCTGDWKAVPTKYTCSSNLGGSYGGAGLCCEKVVLNNECEQEGGTCSSSKPVGQGWLPHNEFSCGSAGGTCWRLDVIDNPDGTVTPVDYSNPYTPPTDKGYKGPVFTSFTDVVAPVAKVLYYAGVTIGVGAVILAGYMLMTSEGNPDRVKQGQEQLTAAILGVLFILLSAAILRIIIGTFFGLGF